MIQTLTEKLCQALQFRNISPDAIDRIDAKVGFIWFKAGQQTYQIDIKEADFDLNKYD